MLCGDLNGKAIQKTEDICLYMADSLCCTAENNITLSRKYTPIKFFLKTESAPTMLFVSFAPLPLILFSGLSSPAFLVGSGGVGVGVGLNISLP